MDEQNKTGTQADTQPDAGSQDKNVKTFTQEDVNRMMAAEKEQGRKSILKELGVQDVASAKEGLQKYQEFLNSQKSELEKAQASEAKLQSDYAAAIARANHAENCIAAMKLGANTESIDDLVTLAMSKVSETKDFATVLSEMKSNSVFSGFFQSSVGTGNGGMQGHPAGEGETTTSLAKQLAEKQIAQKSQKSNYFKMS